MTNFSARWFVTTNFADTVGRSLEFDLTNNAIWQKGPDKPVFKINYNSAVSLGGTRISATNVLALTNFPTGLMGIGMDLTRKLAAGVFSNSPLSADTLNLYDISNSNAPVLVDQYAFATSPRNGNNNRISQTFFKNDLLFTIDGNNGIMVFRTVADSTPEKIELADFRKAGNAGFQFSYSNSAGWPYRIFSSSNLVNWQFVGAATQAWPGLFRFTDAATNGSRFYQLRWP